MSKYGVISGPSFLVFVLKTERYGLSLRIQSEYRNIRTRNNSVFGHFPRSVGYKVSNSLHGKDEKIYNVGTGDDLWVYYIGHWKLHHLLSLKIKKINTILRCFGDFKFD